jgi:hypothetical protein
MVGRSVVVLTVLAGALAACGGEDGTGQTMDAGLTCEDTTPLERPSFFGPCDEPVSLGLAGCTTSATTAADPRCQTRACLARQSACYESLMVEARSCAECRGCGSAVIVRDCQIACERSYSACVSAAVSDAEINVCRTDLGPCEAACGVGDRSALVGCPA